MRNVAIEIVSSQSKSGGVLCCLFERLANRYNGKTRTVTQGVLDGQQNALAVQNIFNNQSWLNATKGCHP